MWSDNETRVDLLRFGYLAVEVADIVTAKNLLPVTVGVFGDWGSGKSSLIRMVQDTLSGRAGVMTLQFNGWLFEGYDDAKTALMGSILDAIEERVDADKTLPTRARELVTKLLHRVNWLHAAGFASRYALPLVAGLPHVTALNLGHDALKIPETAKTEKSSPGAGNAENLLNPAPKEEANVRKNIRDFRHDFGELLRESKIDTLVVFIDDLDRCLPDTVIATLEAIKLFLFVPGTAFVLGADEALIQYAVRQRFPELPGTEKEVGRDYLEKLVQVPIRVPPLNRTDIESYMNLLFAERSLNPELYSSVCKSINEFHPNDVVSLAFDLNQARALLPDGSVPESLHADFELTAQIVPVLLPGLGGNPRRTKRFLNTLLTRLSLGKRRGLNLERRLLAKLMLLEYIRPEFFRTLATLQANEGGHPRALAVIEEMLRVRPLAESVNASSTREDPSEPKTSDGATRDREQGLSRRAQRATSWQEDSPAPSIEETLPLEVQPWNADPWTQNWVVAEPSLAGVDLRPYFFIAHDRIGALSGTEVRLSPAASNVLARLLAPGPTQELGLQQAQNLSAPDTVAVFENLAQRIREAETLDARSPQSVLFRLAEARSELLPQLVSLYGSLPETKITIATPPLLIRITKNTPAADAARNLVERWSRSSRVPLQNASRTALRRA